jgi:hypothetical protein
MRSFIGPRVKSAITYASEQFELQKEEYLASSGKNVVPESVKVDLKSASAVRAIKSKISCKLTPREYSIVKKRILKNMPDEDKDLESEYFVEFGDKKLTPKPSLSHKKVQREFEGIIPTHYY